MRLSNGLGWPEVILIIIGVVFLAFLVWIVMRNISKASKRSNSLKTPNEPLEIARQRYAKGEITKEQFEQLKKDLS
jgi:putative membrane protein